MNTPDKPTSSARPSGARWTRSDGAFVSWGNTETGKRPWQASWRDRGVWRLYQASYFATGKAAMEYVDKTWPTATS